MVSNCPPSASVAEVATTVRSSYRWVASVPATDSGATTSARLPRSLSSTHATSCGASASSRCAVADSSPTTALACCLRTGSGSSPLISPMPSSAPRSAASSSVNASRNAGSRPVVSRPGRASARPTASPSPASARASCRSSSTKDRARRAARSTRSVDSSACAAEETRSASSCASSTTSSRCGGMICRPASMSTASRLWLVTTMSASRARARDASAKQSAPNGQRAAPTHSRAGMETSRQAESSTPGSSSSRSPVLVSLAQSRRRWICLPRRPASPSQRVGHQVGQRLAGAGARLDEEVLAGLGGPRDGIGHELLPWTRCAARHRADGRGEQLPYAGAALLGPSRRGRRVDCRGGHGRQATPYRRRFPACPQGLRVVHRPEVGSCVRRGGWRGWRGDRWGGTMASAMPVEPILEGGRPFTVADLEHTPDDGRRYELIDGVLIVSAAPGRLHQRAVLRLAMLLVQACPPDLEVFVAPFGIVFGDDTELQPDVLVARRADLTDKNLPAPPVLAVEVLSPSTRIIDSHVKRERFEREGTPAFWVVDPVARPDEARLVAWELAEDGRYRQVADVLGEAEHKAGLPYPVTVRPADLVR